MAGEKNGHGKSQRRNIDSDLSETGSTFLSLPEEHTFSSETVEERSQDLQLLGWRQLEMQEEERRLLARELHDDIGQYLSFIKLELDRAVKSDKVDIGYLQRSSAKLGELIEHTRRLSYALRPMMLDDLGLLETLLWYFGDYTARTGIQVSFSHYGLDRELDGLQGVVVFRVVQEALANIAGRAGANQIRVDIRADDDKIDMCIEDLGAHLDAEALSTGLSKGLDTMRRWFSLIGGQFAATSALGGGTEVRATLPLKEKSCDQRSTGR